VLEVRPGLGESGLKNRESPARLLFVVADRDDSALGVQGQAPAVKTSEPSGATAKYS
jgi:hypothetical protein